MGYRQRELEVFIFSANDTLRPHTGRRNSPHILSHFHSCVTVCQCQATPTTRTQHSCESIMQNHCINYWKKRCGRTKERSLKCSDNQISERRVGVEVPAGLFNGHHQSPAPSAFPDTFSLYQMFIYSPHIFRLTPPGTGWWDNGLSTSCSKGFIYYHRVEN